MLYTGFSEHELQRIIEILERHQVNFEVTANEQAISDAEAIMASKFERGTHRKAEIDNSFYAISLDQEELKKVPVNDLQELIKLRIFPAHMPKSEPSVVETPTPPMRRSIAFTGANPLTGILIMLGLFCLVWAYFNVRG